MAIANITGNILTDSGVATSSLLPLTGGTLTGNLTAPGLTLTTGGSTAQVISSTGTNVYSSLSLTNTTTGYGYDIGFGGSASIAPNSFYIYGGSSASVKLQITATGSSIFSGLVSSATEFRLNNNSFTRVATMDSGGGYGGGYNFNWNNGSPIHDSTGALSGYGYASDGSVRFYANGSASANTAALQRLTITSGGRTIVNSTTDRGYTFQVNGDANSYAVELRQSNNNANYDLLTLTHEATSGNRRMMVFNVGGIGTVGTIISTNSSTTYNTSSDYRLKEDLRDFDGLSKVSSIKVYDFKWKIEDSRTEGVLAHELQEVIPYAVYGEKDEVDENGKPKMQGVDYSKIVPVLIKAIQELNVKVSALENKS